MEVSMKSKLFLSVSLLTAVFSLNANAVTTSSDVGSWMMGTKGHSMISRVKALTTNRTAQAAALTTGYVAGTMTPLVGGLCAHGYMNPVQAPQLTRVQQAQQIIKNGYASVKASALNGYTSVKANALKGYNGSLTFVKAHPKSTAGAVAAVTALGYVAYNSDLFGKSKAPVASTPVAAPVTAPVAKRVKPRGF